MKALSLLLLLVFALNVVPARAATFTATPWYGRSYRLTLSGEITDGDADQFKAAVLKEIRAGHFVAMLVLHTPGGLIDEAMSIGEQLRTLQIQTGAPEISNDGTPICRQGSFDRETYYRHGDCQCASACFLVWVGGIGRRGTYVGVHNPYSDMKAYSQKSITEGRKEYAELEQLLIPYFSKMKVPDTITNVMWANNAREMHYLDKMELNALVNVDPAVNQMVAATCGSAPKEGTIYTNPARKTFYDCLNNVYESAYALGAQDYLNLYGRDGEQVPGIQVTNQPDGPSPQKVVTIDPDANSTPIGAPTPQQQPVPVPSKPSTRPEPATQNYSFLIRNNRDLVGTDLETYKNLDLEPCASRCDANGSCTAFTFDDWNHLCILKTGISFAKIQPRGISGVKKDSASKFPDVLNKPIVMQKYRGTYFPGTGNGDTPGIYNTETCESMCKASRQCVVYTYFKKTNICRVFKSSSQYFHGDRDSADSGVKIQP